VFPEGAPAAFENTFELNELPTNNAIATTGVKKVSFLIIGFVLAS
jgi:hypothetical protein